MTTVVAPDINVPALVDAAVRKHIEAEPLFVICHRRVGPDGDPTWDGTDHDILYDGAVAWTNRDDGETEPFGTHGLVVRRRTGEEPEVMLLHCGWWSTLPNAYRDASSRVRVKPIKCGQLGVVYECWWSALHFELRGELPPAGNDWTPLKWSESVPGYKPEPETETLTFTTTTTITQEHNEFFELFTGSPAGTSPNKTHCGDVLLAGFSGYWLRGVVREPSLGWLAWEFDQEDPDWPNDDEDRRHEVAIATWRRGQALPGGYHRLDRELAKRVLAKGLERYGARFIEDGDYGTFDVALQDALLGSVIYG